VALISPGAALAIDAGTFLVSAVSRFLLRIDRIPRTAGGTTVLGELRDGFGEVRSRTWLWVMILYFGLFNILAFPAVGVLGPYVAKHSLGGAGAWAVILTAGSVGFLIGGTVALRVGSTRPLLYGDLVGPVAAIIGISTTLIGAGILTAIATLAVIAVPSVRNLRTHTSPPGGPPRTDPAPNIA
jgi:hypothetical protein